MRKGEAVHELIDRFNRVAQPYLQVFKPNTCIEQTRILAECLREFGVPVEPIETTLFVHCPKLNLAYVSGATAEERARGKAVAGCWIDCTTTEGEGYGHVLAVAEIGSQFYLIDPTLAQASQPNHGPVIPVCCVQIGPVARRPEPCCQIEAGFELNDGNEIAVLWRLNGTRRFEQTPAWEPSHLWPLIHRIVREMKWAATVETRRKAG